VIKLNVTKRNPITDKRNGQSCSSVPAGVADRLPERGPFSTSCGSGRVPLVFTLR